MHITSNSKSLLKEGRPNERKDEENSLKLAVLTVEWLFTLEHRFEYHSVYFFGYAVILSAVALSLFYQINLEINPSISPNRVNWTNKTRKYLVLTICKYSHKIQQILFASKKKFN